MPRKLPIGISDFKEVVSNYHYIDKSLLIRDVLDASAKILLLPRPRRFGKTLNMTMLRYFFEKTEEHNRGLFAGLAVEKLPECMEKQGRYPVIYLTFKDIKQPTFEECFQQIRSVLAKEFERLTPLLESHLKEIEQEKLRRILTETVERVEPANALLLLTEILHRATGERVILLIDEYDTPIHAAHTNGYYDQGMSLIRDLLGQALKDNIHLERGVLTGILRVARESLFSGLNNLNVYTILRRDFSESFGFTEEEVENLFQEFGLPATQIEGARHWYNGYKFGKSTIYNPWSIINYLSAPDDGLTSYWINTSSNDLIRDLIINGSPELHADLEILLNGGTVESSLDEHISLRDLDAGQLTAWSLMVHAGYLKASGYRQEGRYRIYKLAVPNEEVHLFYDNTISAWMSRTMSDTQLQQMLAALTSGDIKMFGKFLRDLVADVLSVHDVAGEKPERVYHAFTLGLLVNLGNRYRVESNRESGYGRYDVMLTPKDVREPGLVLEFKKFDEEDEADELAGLESALKQIRDKDYGSRLRAAGVTKNTGVAILFKGKRVFVNSEEI